MITFLTNSWYCVLPVSIRVRNAATTDSSAQFRLSRVTSSGKSSKKGLPIRLMVPQRLPTCLWKVFCDAWDTLMVRQCLAGKSHNDPRLTPSRHKLKGNILWISNRVIDSSCRALDRVANLNYLRFNSVSLNRTNAWS